MKGIVFAGHSKIEYLDFPDPRVWSVPPLLNGMDAAL